MVCAGRVRSYEIRFRKIVDTLDLLGSLIRLLTLNSNKLTNSRSNDFFRVDAIISDTSSDFIGIALLVLIATYT